MFPKTSYDVNPQTSMPAPFSLPVIASEKNENYKIMHSKNNNNNNNNQPTNQINKQTNKQSKQTNKQNKQKTRKTVETKRQSTNELIPVDLPCQIYFPQGVL